MEYLSRVLTFKAKNTLFRYHSLSKGIKLINLCFMDDLMVVCKTHIATIKPIKEAMSHFPHATRLQANQHKSQAIGVGVSDAIKARS